MSTTYLTGLAALAIGVIALAPTAQAQNCGAAMPAFQAAIKANTAEAVAAFIEAHPGCFTAPATAKLNSLGGAPAPDTTSEDQNDLADGEAGGTEPSAPRPQLAGFDQAIEAIPACRAGLELMRANRYEHPAEPTDAAGTPMSWAQAFSTWQSDHAPACKTIQAFETFNASAPEVQQIAATFSEQPDFTEKYAPLEKIWNGSIEQTLAVIDGQGSRIPDYCPNLHLVQFNCVTAPERIGYASDWLTVYMDRLELLAGG